ncbi:hypothetical protein [Paraburkholderia tropica]
MGSDGNALHARFGTNSPRMMSDLHAAAIDRERFEHHLVQSLRERALERFAAPQNPIEVATFGSTPISTGLDRHWLRVSDHDWLQPLPVRDLSRHGRPNGGK